MKCLLLAAWCFVVCGAPPGYVDGAVCAACHTRIAVTYAKTGMGRSFRAARKDVQLREFDLGGYDHPASGDHFVPFRRGDRYSVRRYQTGSSGQPVDVLDEVVDYVIGSGDHAVSYLHRTPDNRLIEFPISWYEELGGHWGMSPGYDRPDHPGFSREIPFRCMFCHNGYPEVSPQLPDWTGATVFPAQLPEGIDCQRCHGPGAAHVAAARAGSLPESVRNAIVNPARLAPLGQTEVCMQCHLETAGMQTPQTARGIFSYIPGQPLGDYMLYFDPAKGSGDRFELVSSAYRFRKSECFRKSGGTFTCITCHDPHTEPSRPEALQKANGVCASCHGANVAVMVKEGRHTAAADCAGCHMPRRQGVDAIHITITDHWIQKPPPLPVTPPYIEEQDGNTLPYVGAMALYYPDQADPLETAIAQVREFANVPVGLSSLEKLLASRPPQRGGPFFELAEALFGTGQAGRSIPFYQKATELEPENWRYRHALGQALDGSGKPALAVENFQKAVALAPSQTALLESLGAAYAELGRMTDALQTLREALRRNPEDASAQNNLGRVLTAVGDNEEGAAAFREAVRLQPEMGALRMTDAALLLRGGRLSEARYQLERAILAGPASGSARAAWFARLAATGDAEEARGAYETSMRKQLSPAHNNLGNVLLALGDPAGAMRELRLAVDADPESALAQLNLGQTLLEHGFPDEGRQHLRLAAASNDLKVRGAATELLERR